MYYDTLHYNVVHYTTLPVLHYTVLQYTKLHYTKNTAMYYNAMHYLYYLMLHYLTTKHSSTSTKYRIYGGTSPGNSCVNMEYSKVIQGILFSSGLHYKKLYRIKNTFTLWYR